MSKSMVHATIVAVTTVGATSRGDTFILSSQIDKLEHGLGVRMESLKHKMGVIDSHQERLKKNGNDMGRK